jgi:glycosyltransferase involved in cell wall biosynthesis
LSKKDVAVFVMPRSTQAWRGADALWITVAGWAAAHQQNGGIAIIATTDAVLTIDETIALTGRSTGVNQLRKQFRSWVLLKQIVKDIQLFRKPSTWPVQRWLKKQSIQPVFIWEQHDLVAGIGISLAKQYKVPLIKYVHAPVVWETKKWGVNRGAWGWFLERYVERNALKKATVVAAVTQQVKQKLLAMQVPATKILVSPMAVDADRFTTIPTKMYKGICFGWMGSFRLFHGLQTVLQAFANVISTTDATLLLVGDGADKPTIEQMVADLNIQQHVVFTGKKKFVEIPAIIASMDVCVVSANNAESFHYSPLKLREFMAAGKACIAPMAGDLPHEFTDGEELLLYQVGSVESLTDKFQVLIKNANLRQHLGNSAKRKIHTSGTWLHQLRKTLQFIENSK